MQAKRSSITMTLFSVAAAGGLLMLVSGGADAHVDDPKEKWIDPMYDGPGWQSGALGAGSMAW